MSDPSAPEPQRRTGVPAVDAALAAIDDLDDLPVREHAGRFEAVHAGLQGALSDTPAAAHHDPGREAASDDTAGG